MKVTIERSVLLKALGHVHRIVERRNTIPILANVLIEAADGRFSLKSTDLDLEASESAPRRRRPRRRDDGSGPCPLRHRAQAPGGRAGEPGNDGDTGQLLVRSGRSRFHLQALPASDFPDLTSGDFPHRFAFRPWRSSA